MADGSITRGPLVAAELMRAWRSNPKAQPFAATIDSAAAQHGIPGDLLGSLIQRESQFNPNARSPAGAVGLAQLMPVHKVNARDPAASTAYAAQYLRQLHDRFGNWDQALAAYNYGPTNVSRALRRHGDQWQTRLPRETRNYIQALGHLPE